LGKRTSCRMQKTAPLISVSGVNLSVGVGFDAYVIKSKFAFSKLKYEGFDVAEKDQYYVLRKARDDEANQLYLEMLEEESDGLYIQDIMRGGLKNDDPRIPRNISE